MIIILLGGIGSGKTLSAVKEITDNDQYALTNFNLKNMKNYHRIKVSNILKKYTNEKDKPDFKVNWEFWEKVRKKHKNYSIYLDEIHNIIHSRRSMSKVNILMSKWVSQIRKILSDSPNNHLYLISQTLRKIDIDFRDLAQIFIWCRKFDINGNIYIKQFWYDGLDMYLMNRRSATKIFKGNRYFKYYRTGEMITFSDAEQYL